MRRRTFVQLSAATGVAAAMPAWPALAAPKTKATSATKAPPNPKRPKKDPRNNITTKERLAAAKELKDQGFVAEPIGVAQMAMPGMAPHYFTHPNYANSKWPVPSTVITPIGNARVDRAYATDNATTAFVVNTTALPAGLLKSFEVWNQASAGGSFQPSAGLSFHAYVLRPTGTPNQYTVAYDSGVLTMPALADPSVGEVATFAAPDVPVQVGDLFAHYGQGVPMDIGAGSDLTHYPVATAPVAGATVTLGDATYPTLAQARTYSIAANVQAAGPLGGGIRKFVNELPGLGAAAANNLGQYIPLAKPDTTTFPGSSVAGRECPAADYYEIAVVEYEEQMHSDLPATKLRGYVQLETSVVQGAHHPLPGGHFGVDKPHYLGPTIVAQKDRPVRILFRNLLPTGQGGNLFLPVDTTVMGSGMGPDGMPDVMDALNPHAGMDPKPAGAYSENRATLHLHGGISPWISDGTPHQWTVPAGEAFQDGSPMPAYYKKGVSTEYVPDMWFRADGSLIPQTDGLTTAPPEGVTTNPGEGAMTFYYTNQQSARLLFYHDHAWGITRLNVYAGEAAPYLIQDQTENSLFGSGGPFAALGIGIPLVVQDKSFVPSMEQLATQDELWDTDRWGGEGQLWLPHVYNPIQNPGSSTGANAFGRWAYGPWFWPPVVGIKYGPVPNPYDPEPGEPPLMPGVPYNSMGMEAFMDTPVVNGTAYPYLEIDPKPYRFRILNAANDRFFNLSLYKAMGNGAVWDGTNLIDNGAAGEVELKPEELAAALEAPTDVMPTPVAGAEGPSWIQIGTEGGFLPAPVVIPPHVTTWWNDMGLFIAGNVNEHSLLLGPAERADVIVDFSQYAGQTLILYNDAPAAFPARDPRYDYYTGNADLKDAGGAPPTLPGYGPNTRTVMQIRVAAGTGTPFNKPALDAAFAHKADGSGVFESSQHPIVVGQGAYNSAYGTSFMDEGETGAQDGLCRIGDMTFTFPTLAGQATVPPGTLTFTPKTKMIQDEQGEAFDPEYGRMSGFLGVETPFPAAGRQNMILYSFTYPPTEVLDGIENSELAGMGLQPITVTDDGTQIWKITHNGVDTHPIHFHLYDVQLVNRVGWDGMILKNDLNELGWKDTVRISPLMDTIVALRPLVPTLPWPLPNSVRLIDPSMKEGHVLFDFATWETNPAATGMLAFNPDGEPINLVNHKVNFGLEYVWHCHILSHEEMDMMRAQAVAVKLAGQTLSSGTTPGLSDVVRGGTNQNRVVTGNIGDVTINETAFVLERAITAAGPWTVRQTIQSNGNGPTTGLIPFTDTLGNDNTTYVYQVKAINVVGDAADYSDPNINEIPPGGGFPTVTLESAYSVPTSWVPLGTAPAQTAPAITSVTAARQGGTARATVNWTYTNGVQTGFQVQRADDAAFTTGVAGVTVAANSRSYTFTGLPRGRVFYFRVRAYNLAGASDWSNTGSASTP